MERVIDMLCERYPNDFAIPLQDSDTVEIPQSVFNDMDSQERRLKRELITTSQVW